MNIPNIPSLIEPGVKYFLTESLKQCHQIKETYTNTVMNLMFFIIFALVISGILIYRYKGKITPEERKEQELQKQQYILSKIKQFSETQARQSQQLITNLPHWE